VNCRTESTPFSKTILSQEPRTTVTRSHSPWARRSPSTQRKFLRLLWTMPLRTSTIVLNWCNFLTRSTFRMAPSKSYLRSLPASSLASTKCLEDPALLMACTTAKPTTATSTVVQHRPYQAFTNSRTRNFSFRIKLMLRGSSLSKPWSSQSTKLGVVAKSKEFKLIWKTNDFNSARRVYPKQRLQTLSSKFKTQVKAVSCQEKAPTCPLASMEQLWRQKEFQTGKI